VLSRIGIGIDENLAINEHARIETPKYDLPAEVERRTKKFLSVEHALFAKVSHFGFSLRFIFTSRLVTSERKL
jgi:hypothetical protein